MKWPLLAAKKSNTNILINQYYTVKLNFLLHTVWKFKFLKYYNSNYDIATWKVVVELSSITTILQIKYCFTHSLEIDFCCYVSDGSSCGKKFTAWWD